MSSFIAPPNSFCALVCRRGMFVCPCPVIRFEMSPAAASIFNSRFDAFSADQARRCARFLYDLCFIGCSWRCLGVRFSRLSTHPLAFEFLRQFTLEALLLLRFRR